MNTALVIMTVANVISIPAALAVRDWAWVAVATVGAVCGLAVIH